MRSLITNMIFVSLIHNIFTEILSLGYYFNTLMRLPRFIELNYYKIVTKDVFFQLKIGFFDLF